MEKEIYETPVTEIIIFHTEDVIKTSGNATEIIPDGNFEQFDGNFEQFDEEY